MNSEDQEERGFQFPACLKRPALEKEGLAIIGEGQILARETIFPTKGGIGTSLKIGRYDEIPLMMNWEILCRCKAERL